MNLSEYLSQTGQSRATFAAQVGVSTQAVSLWINRKRWPDPVSMRKIKTASGNLITSDHMLDAHTP
jgi:DNA-binding transcriptional regulator YiaG